MNLRCIIVDDEPMARRGLEEELKEITFLEVVGVAENAYQAVELVATLRPDLILLDIEMPRLNGLDLIQSLSQSPMVIVITAYPEYALKGYELDVMDYLIKPVDFNRLLKACCKAKEFHALRQEAGRSESGEAMQQKRMLSAEGDQGMQAGAVQSGPGDGGEISGVTYFFVKCNGRHEKILFRELLFVEAADNYVILYTSAKKFMVYDTLKNMEALLPAGDFMKVHKSYIVALDKVAIVEGHVLTIAANKIPVSRNCREEVLRRVVKSRR